MPRSLHLAVLSTTLIALAGCSQSHNRDTCGDVPACDEAGARRCDLISNAIEVCQQDELECLGWVQTEVCVGECAEVGGEPTCIGGCDDECVAGESQCEGETILTCGESEGGCLVWNFDEDCAENDQFCDDSSGDALCTSECVDTCDRVGTSRCDGDVVETCEDVSEGCRRWTVVEDCSDSGEHCDDSTGSAGCTSECVDECDEEDTMFCDGDTVVLCDMDLDGCLALMDMEYCPDQGMVCAVIEDRYANCICPPEACVIGTRQCEGDVVVECQDGGECPVWTPVADCAELGLPCDEATGECVTGTGAACDSPIVLWEFPSTIAGDSFSADFGYNEINFTSDTCLQLMDMPEAVFAVDLEAGESLYMSERMEGMDGVNVAFDVLTTCDETAECLYAADRGEAAGFTFFAEAGGRYFVVVEAADRADGPYEIVFDVFSPEDCGDGDDNDGDGAVDCDDPDCYGDPTSCSTETNCGDGADNDLDGATDCDDPDCGGATWCAPPQGIWEVFGEGDLPDVVGHQLTFEPDAAAPNGYRWSEAGGVTGFAVTPGSGVVSTTLPAADDNAVEVAFSVFPGFEFYGVDYSTVFVSTNGFVTFDEGSNAWNNYLDELFLHPGISALRSDLNPASGGSVVVDELADRFVVTWQGVPRYGRSELNDVQMVLDAGGTITLYFVTVGTPDALVGIAAGPGLGATPPETDFVLPEPEDCDDGVDNDFDGAIDCSDSDCFGTTACAVEVDCGDGADNDLDGAIDCDDADCAGPACEPFLGYWERFTDGDPPDLQGRSIRFVPDAADPMGYTWSMAPMSSTGFPQTPGAGDVTETLSLGDNTFAEHGLTVMAGFPFYGTAYTSVFVSQNGYVTFGAGSGSADNEVWNHFELPSVAAYRRDLYNVPTDVYTVDEYADRVVVTYQGVVSFAGMNDFQIVLHGTGEIDLHYVTVPVVARVTGLVGISNGGVVGDYPAESNFVP